MVWETVLRSGRARDVSIPILPGRHRARIWGICSKLEWISVSSGIPTLADLVLWQIRLCVLWL